MAIRWRETLCREATWWWGIVILCAMPQVLVLVMPHLVLHQPWIRLVQLFGLGTTVAIAVGASVLTPGPRVTVQKRTALVIGVVLSLLLLLLMREGHLGSGSFLLPVCLLGPGLYLCDWIRPRRAMPPGLMELALKYDLGMVTARDVVRWAQDLGATDVAPRTKTHLHALAACVPSPASASTITTEDNVFMQQFERVLNDYQFDQWSPAAKACVRQLFLAQSVAYVHGAVPFDDFRECVIYVNSCYEHPAWMGPLRALDAKTIAKVPHDTLTQWTTALLQQLRADGGDT